MSLLATVTQIDRDVPVSVMQWSPLIVTITALFLVVSVACGGESKPTPSPTATSAPSPTTSPGIMEPKPGFDLLPEVSAPAGLGTIAWPNNFQEGSALFGRLPSEIAGHRIKARFEQVKLGAFSTTYEDDPEIGVAVHDLAKGDFFPTDTNAGQFVALLAQLPQWEVVAAGREGDLAWVQFKDDDIYGMNWGNAPSSIVFQAMANDLSVLMALVEAMVSAASG